MNILLGFVLLFLIFLAVSLLAAWYGSWMYKRGHRDGYHACKREIEMEQRP